MPLSLSRRLALLYVGLLVLLLTTLGALLYLDTRRFVFESTTVRLRAQAKPVIERWLHAPAGGSGERSAQPALAEIAGELARALTSRDTAALIVDARGQALAHGKQLAEEPDAAAIETEHIVRALAGDNEVNYIVDGPAERTLVSLVPLRPAPGSAEVVGVAQLSTSLVPIDSLLAEQRWMIILGIAAAIALGTGGGLWLTTASLAPLRRMVATCRTIAGGDLSQRVNLPERRDEIGQLARAFDDMVARIEAGFATQHRFIGDAAHELRTPLTALKGSLEVLLRGSQDNADDRRRLAQGMHREVTRLVHLSEQLLDMTRLETPAALHRMPVALGRYLEEFMPQAGRLAHERSLSLDPGPAVTLALDPDALQQALVNLVSNAAQHTAPGNSISISWRLRGDEAVELVVADRGEGIAERDLPHIFEPLYRGDASRSRRRGGAGLGLALVKRVVELHGGTIEARSRPGQGATFTITLPRSA